MFWPFTFRRLNLFTRTISHCSAKDVYKKLLVSDQILKVCIQIWRPFLNNWPRKAKLLTILLKVGSFISAVMKETPSLSLTLIKLGMKQWWRKTYLMRKFDFFQAAPLDLSSSSPFMVSLTWSTQSTKPSLRSTLALGSQSLTTYLIWLPFKWVGMVASFKLKCVSGLVVSMAAL